MDVMSREQRSRNMSRIRSKNTRPEIDVRKYLFSRGYRYRVNYNITGKPDIVFPKKKIAIFIHGCFWHLHGCKYSTMPKTNKQFWENKLNRNKIRDKIVESRLDDEGWKIYTVWECELKEEREICLKKLENYIKNKNICYAH
ncbi:MAG: very short patch repair endonuclease [Alkaliphilus sp.]|nr:very short patch repair endonuclease [Alkaliphilus sp.]